MLLLLLGMCVFVWGLGYKLSLYETPTSSIHRIPEAKLLSRNEDRSAADSLRFCLAKAASLQQVYAYTFILAIALLSFIGASANAGRRYIDLPAPWGPQWDALQSIFFLRPPPVFFSF
jgi:hypothetical protein